MAVKRKTTSGGAALKGTKVRVEVRGANGKFATLDEMKYIHGLKDGVIELTGELDTSRPAWGDLTQAEREHEARQLELVEAEVWLAAGSARAVRVRRTVDGPDLDAWLPRSQITMHHLDGGERARVPSTAFENDADEMPAVLVRMPRWLGEQRRQLEHHDMPFKKAADRMAADWKRGLDFKLKVDMEPVAGKLREAADAIGKVAEAAREQVTKAFMLPAELVDPKPIPRDLAKHQDFSGGVLVPAGVAEALRNLKPGHVLRAGPVEVPIARRGAEIADEHRKHMMKQIEDGPSACAAFPAGSRGRPQRKVELVDEATATDLLCDDAEES